jgi:predicted small metal-binding protein
MSSAAGAGAGPVDIDRVVRFEGRTAMYEHSCAKAGAEGCGYVVRAASEEELKAKVGEHARKKHNVQGMTDTIYTYLRNAARL